MNGMPTPRTLAILALLVAVATLVGYGAAEGDERDARLRARGVDVYLEQSCGTCHALGLAGTRGPFGPPHDAMGVIAAARVLDPGYRGEATDAAGYVRESIVAPLAYVVPGYAGTYHRMPAYTFLNDADLDALVALLSAPPTEGRE